MFTMDYQVVVLAGGRGTRMTDLTNTIPKCLLPVANIPMIVYPLAMLQNANFTEALILVPAKCSADVRRILIQHNIALKLEFFDIPDDEDLGTAEALQLVLHKITRNALIVSCDFICDFALGKFIDWHKAHGASLSVLLSKTSVQGNAPGPKVKRKTERDLFGLQPVTNRLAFMSGETDFEDEYLSLHRNLLLKFPNIDFTTKLTDCHVYLLDKHLLDIMKVVPNEFVSLKTDLLPFIIKLQHYKWTSIPKDIQRLLSEMQGLESEDCSRVKCLAYLMNTDEFSICARVNATGAYFETNKQVSKSFPKIFVDPAFAPVTQTHPIANAQTGADSLFGSGNTSGRKTQIKRSIVGKCCTLGENCKLNNCLIMDHVRIGDGSTLVNCIVCHSSEIAEKCDLKDCLLATNQRVHASAKLSAEVVGSDVGKMMEI